jgi:hypothetical protein
MYQLYNILLAFWPVLWFGLHDKSTKSQHFYQNKKLYKSFHQGHKNQLSLQKYFFFNLKAVAVSVLNFYLM